MCFQILAPFERTFQTAQIGFDVPALVVDCVDLVGGLFQGGEYGQQKRFTAVAGLHQAHQQPPFQRGIFG